MMDADVEPEPCRDCMTPIPPGWGWCADCDREHHEPCPMGCGRTTEDVAGGPCNACWDAAPTF